MLVSSVRLFVCVCVCVCVCASALMGVNWGRSEIIWSRDLCCDNICCKIRITHRAWRRKKSLIHHPHPREEEKKIMMKKERGKDHQKMKKGK